MEKRLKQNREAARRSRERKRMLKEELQRRMPLLQKQHDDMVAEVDELMKSMWVRFVRLTAAVSDPCSHTFAALSPLLGKELHTAFCKMAATHASMLWRSIILTVQR